MIVMNKHLKRILPSILLLLALANTLAAQAEGTADADPYFYDRLFSNGMIITTGAVIVAAFVALLYLLNVMVKVQQLKIYQEEGLDSFLEQAQKDQESWWDRMYKRLTDAVPVEKERDVMLDHDYDGIKELDNSLPPWWVAMFYLSIAFAVVYMSYYHFTDAGPSSTEEYEIEMERAEKSVKAYLATQANLVDESNAEPLTDEASLAGGKSIFNANCAACHGMMGEGGVGPNMTDPYWIHGGDIKDIFKTVKYGVPEKGMIAWKAQLSSADIHQVSSYILTLQGTNPPNAKEPEGELYQQADGQPAAPASDSTATEEVDEGAVGMIE
jgi:cytochrome c oxidase cbb3-type subunit 3